AAAQLPRIRIKHMIGKEELHRCLREDARPLDQKTRVSNAKIKQAAKSFAAGRIIPAAGPARPALWPTRSATTRLPAATKRPTAPPNDAQRGRSSYARPNGGEPHGALFRGPQAVGPQALGRRAPGSPGSHCCPCSRRDPPRQRTAIAASSSR